MLERLTPYLRPPVFPDDEDKTFTASLLHVILWSVLVGVCLYTFIATILSLIQPHMLLIAWLYVLAIVALTLTLMVVMRRGLCAACGDFDQHGPVDHPDDRRLFQRRGHRSGI